MHETIAMPNSEEAQHYPNLPLHVDLAIGEIHLGVLPLELLQNVELLLLVGRRQAHSLLPLVVHHLFDRLPRLAVEVAQVRVLRLDPLQLDFRIALARALPPLHVAELLEGEDESVAVLDGPEGVVDDDRLGEGRVDDWFGLAAEGDLQVLLLHRDVQVAAAGVVGQGDVDHEFLECLRPDVLALDRPAVSDGRRRVVIIVLLVVIVIRVRLLFFLR
mmetsp:Transcript_26783/g.63517  ORF Transcript_26783/g.63517 Transcript_26783/m.63517 type:complete len:217 (-) Transcript_26783:660-1310(-)